MAKKYTKGNDLMFSSDEIKTATQKEPAASARKPADRSHGKKSAGEWTRMTFIVREDYLNMLRAIAYTDKKKIKEVLDEALHNYIEKRKAQGGILM